MCLNSEATTTSFCLRFLTHWNVPSAFRLWKIPCRWRSVDTGSVSCASTQFWSKFKLLFCLKSCGFVEMNFSLNGNRHSMIQEDIRLVNRCMWSGGLVMRLALSSTNWNHPLNQTSFRSQKFLSLFEVHSGQTLLSTKMCWMTAQQKNIPEDMSCFDGPQDLRMIVLLAARKAFSLHWSVQINPKHRF